MKDCPGLEELALYAGGDHETTAMRRIQGHVAVCGSCRVQFSQLQEDRELLVTPPPLPEEVLLAVREGVRQRLRNERRRRYAAAVAVAAAVSLAWLLPVSIREIDSPSPAPHTAAVRPSPPAIEASPNPVLAKRIRRRGNIRPAQSPKADNQALFAALDNLLATGDRRPPVLSGSVVVTLQTQDPNVTIILLEPSTGGGE